MKNLIINVSVLAVVSIAMSATLSSWLNAADQRAEAALANPDTAAAQAGTATAADEAYCTPELRVILKRVLTSCGIVKAGGGGRGCQPTDAQSVAAMSGGDFNGLFTPMAERAAIIQFDAESADLDDAARALIDNTFADRRGASYFLIVARSSQDGGTELNRALSEKRAAALYDHLKATYPDPDFEQVAGMLWLGEEFAQLEDQFCTWKRSRADTECDPKALNRSAFVAWIDCRL